MLKKCYFEQVLFSYPVYTFTKWYFVKVLLFYSANVVDFKKVLLCDPANTVDFEKVILSSVW